MIFSKITLKLLNHSKWNCGHGICCYDKHDNSFVEIWLPWKKNNNLSLKFKKCWKFAQIIYKVDVCGGYWIFQFEFGYLNIHLFIQLSKPNVDSIFLHWNVCIFNQSNRIVLLWKQREREKKKGIGKTNHNCPHRTNASMSRKLFVDFSILRRKI